MGLEFMFLVVYGLGFYSGYNATEERKVCSERAYETRSNGDTAGRW